jgi:hypothetical protein
MFFIYIKGLKKLFGILQEYLIINNILLYDIRIGGVHSTKNVIVTWMRFSELNG